MDRVIITGANGFIGKYVTGGLQKEGYDLFLIVRHACESSDKKTKQIVTNLASGNVANYCVSLVENADTMIHLAADITVPGNAVTVGNNIDGMLAALEIARKTGVRHFIYLSSIPVIGRIMSTPIDEQHMVIPRTPYHWSKLLGEHMLDAYRDLFNTVTVLRIPSPIGVGMKKHNFLSYILKQMKNNADIEIYGDGKRVQNYIDVRDIADAILRVMKTKVDGIFLIAGERSISNSELVDICKEATDSTSRIIKGRFPDSQEEEKWIISTKKAEAAFGFKARYDIKETVRWIVEETL